MISKGAITKRANEEQLPAQTIERDYVLEHLCADIGATGDPRLVLKGGTLLRLCYFEPYRYSADLDFSAIDGLSRAEAAAIMTAATTACRERVELPTLEVSAGDQETAWVTYVGPLASRPRTLTLDTSLTRNWWRRMLGSACRHGGRICRMVLALRVTRWTKSAPRSCAASPSGFSAAIFTTCMSYSTAATSIRSKRGSCTSGRPPTTSPGAGSAPTLRGGPSPSI
jgi:hypothetical protein